MKLNEFLVKAKINTYATSGEGGEKNLEDGSRELVYEESGWKYRDRYFGFNPFIGEEVVWQKGKILWAMNYYGRILSGTDNAEEIYKFLKKVLALVNKSTPFRGPRAVEEKNFSYRNSSSGSVEEFHGVEMILYKGQRVYELEYHGGLVNK